MVNQKHNTAELSAAAQQSPSAGIAQRQRLFGPMMLWTIAYLFLAVLPLGLAISTPPTSPRGFWVEFAVGLGFVGLSVMGLQFALTARFRRISGPLGIDDMLQFHRQAGFVAWWFVLAHPVILILANQRYLSFFDPRVNLMRTLALGTAIIALLLVVGLPMWWRRLGMTYEWWRLTHGLLAGLVMLIGLAHVLMVGRYVNVFWKQAVWVLLVGVPLYLLVHTRVIRPFALRGKPWRVVEVQLERERVWTVALEPQNHDGLRFRAGQFAWVTFGRSPLSLQQHPFSFASSAEQSGRVEFTIKELGDFTSTIGSTAPGTTAYVDGPYGTFTIDEQAEGFVFIAGGIGITPIMSMLRTLRDRGDQRPMLLLYGNNTLAKAAFRSELEALQQQLNLTTVHVVENPPEDWRGEQGFITGELLARHLESWRTRRTQYLVCGPPPMMDLVEQALVDRGVPMAQVYAERFDIV